MQAPPCTASTILRQFAEVGRGSASAMPAISPDVVPKAPQLLREYRPWRKFRFIAADAGIDPTTAWATVKFMQLPYRRVLRPLIQQDGDDFALSLVPQLHEVLHRIDRTLGGGGSAALEPEHGVLGDEDQQRRFRLRTLMDEAAESSLIEGASGTRKQAVELLRSGRAPRAPGEQMIVNNFVAMQRIKTLLDQPLSTEMLCELQGVLTRDTLDMPGEAGRLRRPDEPIRVVDERDGATIYVPPPAGELPSRLARLCEFANRDHVNDEFIHPIIKASILHFMIGYEHPFCDGNGRTARAVFYWHALRQRYPIFEYLSISERIRAGFARYPQAYIDSELEDGDLTHFALYKLDIIEQSLEQFAKHLSHEEAKIRRSAQLLRLSKDLNLRQRLLLEHALRHPSTQYTVKSHSNSNGIEPKTARSDLQGLVRRKLMVTSTKGKEVVYHPAPNLGARLAKTRR